MLVQGKCQQIYSMHEGKTTLRAVGSVTPLCHRGFYVALGFNALESTPNSLLILNCLCTPREAQVLRDHEEIEETQVLL